MSNPVLVNDLRKSLFRRKPVLAVALMAVIIVLLTYGIAGGLPMDIAHQMRQMPLWRFPDLCLPILAPAFAAGAFAKEYEQRTWQDVLLTRLSVGEILGGKFFAALLPTMAAIIVLIPPFALLLILQGVDWALNPGAWMLVLPIKFLISATFYLSLVLVCSYHCSSVRMALVVSYVSMGVYALLSYGFWNLMIVPLFIESYPQPSYSYYPSGNGYVAYSGSSYGSHNLWDPSASALYLSPIEWLHLFQSILLSIGLLGYLATRLNKGRT